MVRDFEKRLQTNRIEDSYYSRIWTRDRIAGLVRRWVDDMRLDFEEYLADCPHLLGHAIVPEAVGKTVVEFLAPLVREDLYEATLEMQEEYYLSQVRRPLPNPEPGMSLCLPG